MKQLYKQIPSLILVEQEQQGYAETGMDNNTVVVVVHVYCCFVLLF